MMIRMRFSILHVQLLREKQTKCAKAETIMTFHRKIILIE